ncbi:MAG: hypothetical protein QXQ48_07585 [Nitrososphaerota archaeon]
MKLVKLNTRDLFNNSIIELLEEYRLEDTRARLEDWLRKMNIMSDSLTYIMFRQAIRLCNSIVTQIENNAPLKEKVEKILSTVSAEFSRGLSDSLARIYISQLAQRLHTLSVKRSEKQLRGLLSLKSVLQNTLIEEYARKYRKQNIGSADYLIGKLDILEEDETEWTIFMLKLTDSYHIETLDTLLYLFTSYRFDKTKFFEQYSKAEDEEAKEKVVEELVEDARKRQAIEDEKIERARSDLTRLMKETIDKAFALYSHNPATELSNRWGRLCEIMLYAILFKNDVLFSFNAHLNPNVVGQDGVINEFDSIVLSDDGRLVFNEVTNRKELGDKLEKCSTLIRKLPAIEIMGLDEGEIEVWIIHSMHIKRDHDLPLPSNMRMMSFPEFAELCSG